MINTRPIEVVANSYSEAFCFSKRVLFFAAALFVWLCWLQSISNGQVVSSASNRQTTSNATVLTTATPEKRTTTRAKVVIEVQGSLRASDDKKDKPLPIKAIAQLSYDEQRLNGSTNSRRSARYYHNAEAQIEVAKQPRKNSLRDDRRFVICEDNPTSIAIYSSAGPLSRDEIDLLTSPANTLLIDDLLPTEAIKNGDTFVHSDDLLAKFTNIHAVTGNDVKSEITSVETDLVRMTIKGSIIGSIDGVSTDIELSGKYNFDRKLNRITWAAINIKENRATGPTTPGFEVTARVRVVIGETAETRFIERSVAMAPAKIDGFNLVEFRPSDCGFEFLLDRRWHVFSQRGKKSVLRLVENGDTIAQMNIRELPTDPKREVTIEAFKKDVLDGLEAASPRIVDANESTNSAGLKVVRALVVGSVKGSPVQWIYYHTSDKNGQGLSYVFTMSGDVAERFGPADVEVTNNLRFIAQTPTTPPTTPLQARSRSLPTNK